MGNNNVILTFSHLPWHFVYQRPQQLLSRFARSGYRIVFIEEPVPCESNSTHWVRSSPEPGIDVFQPRTPIPEYGFADANVALLKPILSSLLNEMHVRNPAVWLYTPMGLPLLDGVNPRVVVYDAMDELSKFLYAPAQLVAREDRLFETADVVFTGGPSLYRAKQDRHPNVHCFPSSVDSAHFGAARSPMPDPAGQAAIPRPRLGFFGVIDERMDIDLLDAAAAARPGWQFVMIGPVVKIDPDTLPKRPNIHYLGQKDYADLPAYLSNWDACLLPFARNEATRFISPTKTLEYMAARKMIAGTPIPDVAAPYSRIVYLGSNAAEFVDACEQALDPPPEDRRERLRLMDAVLSRTSWDATAAAMRELMEHAASGRAARRRARRAAPVVIGGAGPTGLSAAYHLGEDSLLLEQAGRPGGWCRSVVVDGFTFDYAGHIMFSSDPYVHQLYQILLGDNVHWQDREAWIYTHGVYTRYPFQGSLYGLPPQVIKECLMGAIEAQRRRSPTCAGHIDDCCADGILESEARLAPGNGAQPRNFEEFIYRAWGSGIAKHFAIPYNRKLWGVPAAEMDTSWLGGRVPLPDLEEMIEGALQPAPKPMGPNARFGYPLRGGFQALMDGFLPRLKGEARFNSRIAAVSPSRRALTLAGGETIEYERFISTIPLPVLVRMIGDEAPPEVRAAAAALRHVSVRCVHLGIGRPNVTGKHWIYFPTEAIFHRIFAQGNASPHCNAPGGFGLSCEITYSRSKPLPLEGDDLVRRCIDDCRAVGILRPDDPVWTAAQCDLPYAYVLYDHARAASVALIREWLEKRDILLAGRYSEWEYYNSDHAFIAGRNAAERIREGRVLSGAALSATG